MPAPQYTRNQILNQNTNDFPNNNGGLITPAILRDYNANVANSVVFRDEPIDNAVSASFATFALTASYTPNQASSSYALSSSFALTASFLLGSIASSSYAAFADNAGKLDGLDSTSFVGTASYNADSSSFSSRITAQEQFSASLDATFATDAQLNAVSSSITNRLTTDESSISSLNAATSSFVRNNQTSSMSVLSSSYALTASFAANVPATASYALQALSSSFASTIANGLTITASNLLVSQNLTVNGTTNVNSITASNALVTSASIAYLEVIYQTSSIIVSSGSNIFGDQANDVQTLWGTVDIRTGPVLVTGSLNVSQGITGSLLGSASFATNALTASFLSGTALSSSYAISASRAETAGTAATASYVLNAISSSYSLSSSISNTSISASVALNANTASYVLNAVSASFATTASHVTGTVTSASFASTASFINRLNQAVVITGSVTGNVVSASISSATASLDFSTSNFFTSLASGSTFYNITNPQVGQTVNLLITTAGVASASFSSNVKQVSGSRYAPTSGSAKNDVITFISWDGSTVYLANVKNLI
jgi:hypothetical protein